tara:strand:+ start:216 stop:530 length:315 start_codon:yes stop_codon:yes gene_type:complete
MSKISIEEYNKRFLEIYGVEKSDLTQEEEEAYSRKWFIVYYLKGSCGEFHTYKPRKFKNSIEILVQGSALTMYNTRKKMLEFKEYKGKVYSLFGGEHPFNDIKV